MTQLYEITSKYATALKFGLQRQILKVDYALNQHVDFRNPCQALFEKISFELLHVVQTYKRRLTQEISGDYQEIQKVLSFSAYLLSLNDKFFSVELTNQKKITILTMFYRV